MTMKKTCKSILMAALGLTAITSAQASSYYLLLGVTQQGANSTGNDLYYALGNPSDFVDGQQWSLTSLLTGEAFNLNSIEWGAVGDYGYDLGLDDTHTLPEIAWITSAGLSPDAIIGGSAWDARNTPVDTIETTFSGGFAANIGDSTTISAGSEISWNGETIVHPNNSSLFNAYGFSPNQTGTGSLTLWQMLDDGSAPTQLGYLTLDGSGTLTYSVSPVPEPATCGLIGGGALLMLALRNKSSGRSKKS